MVTPELNRRAVLIAGNPQVSTNLKLVEKNVDIEFAQGSLNIDWKSNNNIYMTGGVSKVKKIMV